ncbi:MAG: hypothetical protein R2705_05685 [Ilumatobacteraceae bacterium]
MLSTPCSLPVPAGEVLVSLARRGCAAAVDLAAVGLPTLVAALALHHRHGGLTADDRFWLGVAGALLLVGYHGSRWR